MGTINGMLGKGGFGQVYSGVRNSDLKPVAIKIIKKQAYCSKLVWPTNFDGQVVPLEVYLMQKLNHINGVIKLLEYFETLESYILVLERMVPNIKCENVKMTFAIATRRPIKFKIFGISSPIMGLWM